MLYCVKWKTSGYHDKPEFSQIVDTFDAAKIIFDRRLTEILNEVVHLNTRKWRVKSATETNIKFIAVNRNITPGEMVMEIFGVEEVVIDERGYGVKLAPDVVGDNG